MQRLVLGIVVSFLLFPNSVFAASATVAGLQPGDTVPAGARVTFAVTALGFSGTPTYYVTDSFAGGVTNANIDQWGNFSWTPNTSDLGTHGIIVTVHDAAGNEALASQTITVAKPSISIQSVVPSSGSINIGAPISFSVAPSAFVSPKYSATDSFRNSSLLYSAVNSSGSFYWTPVAQDVGEHTVTITATDAYDNSATASTHITVLPNVTLAVTALSPGKSVAVGQPLTFTITSTGFETPTYTLHDGFSDTSTDAFTVTTAGGVSWTPKTNDLGSHPLTIQATDSVGRSSTLSFIVSVTTAQQVAAPVEVISSVLPVVETHDTTQTTVSSKSNTTNKVTQTTTSSKTTVSTQTATQAASPSTTTPPVLYGDTPQKIPAPEPTQSFLGFMFNHTITFFVSIFSFFKR